jgi:hypothetical protein
MHYLSMESGPYSRWNTGMEITTANSCLPTDFGHAEFPLEGMVAP